MRNANAPGSSSRPGKMGLRAALSCSQLKLLAVDGDGAAMDPRKLPKLQGSLQKRHQHSCLADWGTRYLRVDDRRGVIYYFRSRGASLWDEPAGLFLLRSLESVSALAIPQLPHAFELRFRTQGEGGGGSPSRLLKRSKRDDGPGDEGNPPREPRSSLLLRASSEHELQKWVVGLQTRMAIQAAADAPVPPPAMGPPDPDSAAAAILNATHAASVIAERVASDTSAAEICAAMGVVGAGSRHASLGAAPRKGREPERVDAFLARTTREVAEQIAAQPSTLKALDESTADYLTALGASSTRPSGRSCSVTCSEVNFSPRETPCA